jgi:hypothetical protein
MHDQIKQLGTWGLFLDQQITYLEDCIQRELGHSFTADDLSEAFLETDEVLAKDAVETAVETFIRDNAWPRLTARECRHLEFRVDAARWAVFAIQQEILGDQATWPACPENTHEGHMVKAVRYFLSKGVSVRQGLNAVDLNDRASSIRWLFIKLWDRVGKKLLEVQFLRATGEEDRLKKLAQGSV